MTSEQQAWAAAAIVILTVGIFAFRLFSKKKPGCGGGCGCAAAKKPGAK